MTTTRIQLDQHTGFPAYLTYDSQARAFYLGFDGTVDKSMADQTDYVNVDVDENMRLVGVEVFIDDSR